MLFSLSFMFIQKSEKNGCNIWEMSFSLKLWIIYMAIFERKRSSYELFSRIHSFCWSYEVSVWFPNLIWGLQFPDESRFNIWLRPKTTRFAPSHPHSKVWQMIFSWQLWHCLSQSKASIEVMWLVMTNERPVLWHCKKWVGNWQSDQRVTNQNSSHCPGH